MAAPANQSYDRGTYVKSYSGLVASPADPGQGFALPGADGVSFQNFTMQVNVAGGAPAGLTVVLQLSLDGVNWVDAGSIAPAAIGNSQLVVNGTPALYMRSNIPAAYTPNGSTVDVLLFASKG